MAQEKEDSGNDHSQKAANFCKYYGNKKSWQIWCCRQICTLVGVAANEICDVERKLILFSIFFN